MRCTEKDCSGSVATATLVNVRTGCSSYSTAHPCDTCGRLHWPDGNGVFNRQGDRAFLENGRLVNKPIEEKQS